MTTTIENKPSGLENESEQGKNGADEKQNGSDKQKKAFKWIIRSILKE